MARLNNAKVVSIRLEQDDLDWLTDYSASSDLSMSQIVRRAIKEYRNSFDSKDTAEVSK